jgi:hypothetical protein
MEEVAVSRKRRRIPSCDEIKEEPSARREQPSPDRIWRYNIDMAWLIDEGTGHVLPNVITKMIASFFLFYDDPWAAYRGNVNKPLDNDLKPWFSWSPVWRTILLLRIRPMVWGPDSEFIFQEVVCRHEEFGPSVAVTGHLPANMYEEMRVYATGCDPVASGFIFNFMQEKALAKRDALIAGAASGNTSNEQLTGAYEACLGCFVVPGKEERVVRIGRDHHTPNGIDVTNPVLRRVFCKYCNPFRAGEFKSTPPTVLLSQTNEYVAAVAAFRRSKQ